MTAQILPFVGVRYVRHDEAQSPPPPLSNPIRAMKPRPPRWPRRSSGCAAASARARRQPRAISLRRMALPASASPSR